MKRVIFLIFALFLALIATVSGCKMESDSADTTYRIEVGIVSNSTYSTAWNRVVSYGSDITFANIKAIRNYLYQNTTSSYDNSTTGVTASEIHSFLMEHGFTSTQASFEVSAMERIGNDIMFFEYAYSSSYKVWMYAEKE